MGQEIALQAPDPVLGADRAAEIEHDLVHGGVQRLPIRQEHGPLHARRLADIVVDIAVAEMAERYRARARDHQLDQPIGAGHELRHPGHGHGDVVLDAAAFFLLHLAHQLAQAPQRLALRQRRGDDRVGDLARLETLAEQGFGKRRSSSPSRGLVSSNSAYH